jgi:hypothetical protein
VRANVNRKQKLLILYTLLIIVPLSRSHLPVVRYCIDVSVSSARYQVRISYRSNRFEKNTLKRKHHF